MSAEAPKILISAGEASGDRLGAGLAEAILRRRPDVRLYGMGGPKMAAAGVELLQDSSEVSVVGIVEVLARLPAIRRAMRRLEDFLGAERPDLLVPVDFPDFNLRLSARAGKRDVPVVYFVSPQVWAWRRGRVQRIRTLVRRMLVLFPFETKFYEEAGVPVTFVGHPVVEMPSAQASRAEICRRVGLDPDRPVLILLPGSRHGEVRRLLGPIRQAAIGLVADHPGLQLLLCLAPSLERDWILQELERHGGASDIVVHAGDFPEVLSIGAAGIVSSGTASLEAAAWGLPIVVVYRVSPLTHWVGKRLIHVDDVALPNLIAGRRIVPELIQSDCTPENIAREVSAYLDDPARTEAIRRDLQALRTRLGGTGIFDRAADAVLAEIRPA